MTYYTPSSWVRVFLVEHSDWSFSNGFMTLNYGIGTDHKPVFISCLFVLLVISFQDRTLVLVVPVPGHCILYFYFKVNDFRYG